MVSLADRGWQAVTVDFRGHGESDWSSEGDYRVLTFAEDVREVLAQLPPHRVLVGASLGGFTSMLLAGELSPGVASAVVLVDVVPSMTRPGRRGSTTSWPTGWWRASPHSTRWPT